MQVFDATIVVPTNFVFFTISAIVAGEMTIFLQVHSPCWKIRLLLFCKQTYLFCILLTFAGIIFYKEFWGLQALDIFMFLFGWVTVNVCSTKSQSCKATVPTLMPKISWVGKWFTGFFVPVGVLCVLSECISSRPAERYLTSQKPETLSMHWEETDFSSTFQVGYVLMKTNASDHRRPLHRTNAQSYYAVLTTCCWGFKLVCVCVWFMSDYAAN